MNHIFTVLLFQKSHEPTLRLRKKKVKKVKKLELLFTKVSK